MNSIKCNNCGLTNFAHDIECRRCGHSFVAANRPIEVRPRRFSLGSLVVVAAVLGILYYFYTGVQDKVDQVNTNEAQRLSSQPAASPSPGLSRTQSDQQRSGHYGTAIRNSSELKAHENRTRQTEKTVQEMTNSK